MAAFVISPPLREGAVCSGNSVARTGLSEKVTLGQRLEAGRESAGREPREE